MTASLESSYAPSNQPFSTWAKAFSRNLGSRKDFLEDILVSHLSSPVKQLELRNGAGGIPLRKEDTLSGTELISG